MFNKIKQLCSLSLGKYIYYNYLCRSVERHDGHMLFPYRNSVVSISPRAKLILDGNLSLNVGKLKSSRAEAYLILGDDASLHVCGNVSIRYGSTVQVNYGALAEFGHFTCNVGLNIQCNRQITIGEDCMIGRNVTIYDSAYHPTGTNVRNMEISQAPVRIGNHVWLGTNVVVMQGADIGDGAIIGTSAVVRGNIAPAAFVMPKTDEPAVSGMMWARSMDSLQEALKYRKNDDWPVNLQDAEEINYYQERILKLLQSHMGDFDFEASDNLVDGKVLDSLALVTVVSLLMEDFHVDIPYTDVNAYNFNSVNRMARLIARICAGKTFLVRQTAGSSWKTDMEPLELDADETEKTVVQRIFEYATKNPDDIAIIANEKETTYQELAGMIYSISQWMCRQGILEGDCVAIQAVHEDICIACYYAVHLAGAKLVPMEKSATSSRILEIADETRASMVISLQKKNTEDVCWVDYDDIRTIAYNVRSLSEIKIKYPNLDIPCEMIFTTGTTGKSKGVLMTHRHISWYAYSVAECVEMKKRNRFFITTPLNHAGGLRRTHLSLANGCCVVYMDGLSDLGRYFEYIRKYKVTSLYLPPVAIRILLTRTGDKLSEFNEQIDFVYSSSSPLPAGDCEAMRKMLPNSRLYNAYEASETPGVSAYNYNTDDVRNNCLGIANNGVELGILNDEDGTIMVGESLEGQVCVRSKMNMKEYYMEPELTASVWRDDWFISNDLGTMDEQGMLYYHGRRGDVINIGGYKIAPTDVEETALLSGTVSECICVESFDGYHIPYLKLIVVVDKGKSFDATELLAFLGERLESYKVPRKVEVADRIEKTFNGKIDRKAYRAS